jgi:signal transduction histidine kinase
MNAHLLHRRIPESAEADLREPIARIQKSAERMERLIRDLLDLAKIDTGHLAIEVAPVEVYALVSDAIEPLREPAAAKSLRLTHEVATTAGSARCDRERILQVLHNLIHNAVKFTPAGGEVVVRADPGEDEVLFSVRDTGPGIPEEHRRSIFDRYWQASQTSHQGTGLGLSIAKGLVEVHGSRIWVESELGAGSTFFFTLPRG